MNTDLYFQQLEKTQGQTRDLCNQAEELLAQLPGTVSPEQVTLLTEILAQLSTSMEELRVSEEELREQANELRSANELLEVERQRYRDLFETTPDGYVTTNVYGAIQEANQAAAMILGLPPRRLVHKPLVAFVPED